MKILVDYDNIGDILARRGLVNLVDRILSRAPANFLTNEESMQVRLYGGWDRGARMTVRAQELSAEIRRSFPRIWRVPHPITTNVELAESTEALPDKPLSNTFRNEPIRTIKFQQPTKTTCRATDCPIEPLYTFFKEKQCPRLGCAGTPANLGSQDGQKMIDTMIVADMIFLAHKGAGALMLVGHDDDMYPGILTALAMNCEVLHLQPNYNGASTARYVPPTITTYHPVAI